MKTLAIALILSLTAVSASALTIDPQFPLVTFPDTDVTSDTSTQNPTLPLVLLPTDK